MADTSLMGPRAGLRRATYFHREFLMSPSLVLKVNIQNVEVRIQPQPSSRPVTRALENDIPSSRRFAQRKMEHLQSSTVRGPGPKLKIAP